MDLCRALVVPTGLVHHILTLDNGWSTALAMDASGGITVEHPPVVDRLRGHVMSGTVRGVLLRSFTDEIAEIRPNGRPIPVKEVRGWLLADGRLQPMPEGEIFAVCCTDAQTGEPLPPEHAVRYVAAHHIDMS